MAAYSSGSQLEWREVEGGELPSPRYTWPSSCLGHDLTLEPKVWPTSRLGRRYPLRNWGFRCLLLPHLSPLLGPNDRVLASSRQPCCGQTIPCSCCRSSFSHRMLIWNGFNKSHSIGNSDIYFGIISQVGAFFEVQVRA